MLPRLLLAAGAVAALTAFVRNDTGVTQPAEAAVPATAAVATLPVSLPAGAPAGTAARPVRIILAPDGPAPADGEPATFIPTPGSPVGPRGANFARALPQPRTVAVAPDGAAAGPAPRPARSGSRVRSASGPSSRATGAAWASSLPAVVLR